MRRLLITPLMLASFVGLPLAAVAVGCDTVEETKKVDVKDDGTVVKEKSKTTENADGTVTKTEEKKVDRP
jgi:hypothetical protein